MEPGGTGDRPLRGLHFTAAPPTHTAAPQALRLVVSISWCRKQNQGTKFYAGPHTKLNSCCALSSMRPFLRPLAGEVLPPSLGRLANPSLMKPSAYCHPAVGVQTSSCQTPGAPWVDDTNLQPRVTSCLDQPTPLTCVMLASKEA